MIILYDDTTHEINRGGRSAQCPSPPRTWFNSTRPVPYPLLARRSSRVAAGYLPVAGGFFIRLRRE
jgi:hypothetical protein